ncbi:GNAT family N-acetyltransferase [Amycolatopsis antarctica]|uniref:GNAT family N-acetyltransferase n=1 Tax=Amycolatopsis antarctica TaxID=1854586 RepID=A0A263D2R2_9PSEU|nr:GNAT family N-acetyltransferase [Amycolatopsis antarctica]OZM71645.1 GNAT family N-acetyltransferase [Amycolatopsis antarctica]
MIRTATEDDWPAIWGFLRPIMAAGETYTWDTDVTEERARAMWLTGPPNRAVVAVAEDGAITGTAKMGPNHAGPGAHIATASFLVDPAYAGHGVGRALGEHALRWAAAEGYRAMQFNAVVENNTRAVALWESLGFEIIGTLPEGFLHPADGYVGLHIMHRRL